VGPPTERTSPSGAINNAPGGIIDELFDFVVA
jgi:hypothetical protein